MAEITDIGENISATGSTPSLSSTQRRWEQTMGIKVSEPKPLGAIYFIPRCFGIKNKTAAILFMIVIGAFVVAAVVIAFQETKETITATPLPQNIPIRKSLPNIP